MWAVGAIMLHRHSMHTGTGDILWNQAFSQISDLCDLDLGSGHMACRHVSLMSTYQIHWNWKNFLLTYVYTHIYVQLRGQMDTMTDFIETNGKISHREDQVDSDKTSVLYVLLQNYKKKLKNIGQSPTWCRPAPHVRLEIHFRGVVRCVKIWGASTPKGRNIVSRKKIQFVGSTWASITF